MKKTIRELVIWSAWSLVQKTRTMVGALPWTCPGVDGEPAVDGALYRLAVRAFPGGDFFSDAATPVTVAAVIVFIVLLV